MIKNDSKLLHKGIYVGASWITSVIISTAVKKIVNRDRPFFTYPDIQKLATGGSSSFASRHTTEAFATATSLSNAFPRWYVIAPSYLWASLVGYLRLDLGVHYPSDVLVEALVGAGSSWLCHKPLHSYRIFSIIFIINSRFLQDANDCFA